MRYFLLTLFVLAAACHVQTNAGSGQPYIPLVTDQVVVDTMQNLKDGAGMSWKLSPGHYKLEMTATTDGATAEWIGANCAKTQPMQTLTTTCSLPGQGQLVITNPSVFGLGKDVNVTVKVTKLSS